MVLAPANGVHVQYSFKIRYDITYCLDMWWPGRHCKLWKTCLWDLKEWSYQLLTTTRCSMQLQNVNVQS